MSVAEVGRSVGRSVGRTSTIPAAPEAVAAVTNSALPAAVAALDVAAGLHPHRARRDRRAGEGDVRRARGADLLLDPVLQGGEVEVHLPGERGRACLEAVGQVPRSSW